MNITSQELRLSLRALNVLRRADISTVEELRKMSKSELTQIKGMGKGTLSEINGALDKLDIINAAKQLDIESSNFGLEESIADRNDKMKHLVEEGVITIRNIDMKDLAALYCEFESLVNKSGVADKIKISMSATNEKRKRMFELHRKIKEFKELYGKEEYERLISSQV